MNYELEVEGLLKNKEDIHLVAGLAAEVGEVCSIFQKASYKSQPLDIEQLREELGDVYFYTTALANKYGFSMSGLLESNIKKLHRRHGN
jgi:NTP pyrophosphatase (non-canonical NTP hydrolase)